MIEFGAPIFLWGLPAVLLPVLIHLRRRRQPKVLDFPGAFLLHTGGQPFGARRTWVEDVLLMLLRCAMLASVLLLMARPLWRSPGKGAPKGDPADVAVVLDGSPSLGAFGGRPRADLLETVDRIAGEYAGGSRFLAVSGDLRSSLWTEDARSLKAWYGSPSRDDRPGDLAAALDRAAGRIAEGTCGRREIVVVSDFQAACLPARESLPRVLGRVPPGVRVHAVCVGREGSAQAAVLPPEPTHGAPLAGEPFSVRVSVRSLRGGGRRTLSLAVGGRPAGSESLVLLPGETARAEFPLVAEEPGVVTIEARLSGEDDWDGDDARRLAVVVRPRPAVALVRSPADNAQDRALEAALAPFRGSARSRVRLRSIVPSEAAEGALDGVECAVVSGAARLSEREWIAVRRRVEAGMGLLWFAGEGAPPSPATAGLLPASSGGAIDLSAGAGLSFLDAAHPALAPFSEGRNGDLASVAFARARRFDPLAGLQATGNRALAVFASGQPAIVEVACGRGRALATAFRPDAEETSLPREPAFVVFVHAAVTYLSGIRPPLPSFFCGRGGMVAVEQAAYRRQWAVSPSRDPTAAGRREEAARDSARVRTIEIPAGASSAYLPPMPVAGVYGIAEEPAPERGAGETVLNVFMPVEESDLARDEGAFAPLLAASSRGAFLEGPEALAEHLMSLRPGRPLAGPLALLLMALLLVEGLWCALRPRAGGG